MKLNCIKTKANTEDEQFESLTLCFAKDFPVNVADFLTGCNSSDNV
ncbi:MAG: hypothetical protein PSX81_08365 [bacterium]|nr:hypothetical protein [bacterium]